MESKSGTTGKCKERKFAKENELMLESSQGRMGISGKGLSNRKICK